MGANSRSFLHLSVSLLMLDFSGIRMPHSNASTFWIASFFVFMLRLTFCWWGVVEKRENKSKHIYVIIGCSVSLESLFCASAWHQGYPTVTPQIHWAGLRLLSPMST